MNAVLILLTTWMLWALNFGHCALTTFERITTVGHEINHHNENNIMEELFSPHFRKIIVGIYKQNFDNFNELVHLSEISDDVNFNADVLLGLYDSMSKAHHTDIPFHALDLYNKIEALLNVNSTSLHPAKSNELQDILQELLLNTIVPKGSRILESAVYVKGCNLEGTPFDKLIKVLLTTNQTVANITFGAMVAKARWTLPIAELTPILADFSPNTKQNIDLLLSLYNAGPFQEAERNIISEQLVKLRGEPDLVETINAKGEHKIHVNATTPLESQIKQLLRGDVCFYQEDYIPTGKRYYIYECKTDFLMCTHEHQLSMLRAVFRTEFEENPQAFIFRSPHFENRAMTTKMNVHPDFNPVYSQEDGYMKWKAQLDGKQIVLQNMETGSFLCASSFLYARTQESYPSHLDNCKWSVQDCSHLN